MSLKWFRVYNTLIDNPKVQCLPGSVFKHWINLLCIASQNDGKLPDVNSISFRLRVGPKKAAAIMQDLVAAKLIDLDDEGKASPHDWHLHQYQSDNSTERVKRSRQRSKKRFDSESVSEFESVSESGHHHQDEEAS